MVDGRVPGTGTSSPGQNQRHREDRPDIVECKAEVQEKEEILMIQHGAYMEIAPIYSLRCVRLFVKGRLIGNQLPKIYPDRFLQDAKKGG